jgi:hypothetical protein
MKKVARSAVRAFERLFGIVGRLPRRADFEQVQEEIVSQDARSVGEDDVARSVVIRSQYTHAADKCRHLGGGECELLGFVDEQLIGGISG